MKNITEEKLVSQYDRLEEMTVEEVAALLRAERDGVANLQDDRFATMAVQNLVSNYLETLKNTQELVDAYRINRSNQTEVIIH